MACAQLGLKLVEARFAKADGSITNRHAAHPAHSVLVVPRSLVNVYHVFRRLRAWVSHHVRVYMPSERTGPQLLIPKHNFHPVALFEEIFRDGTSSGERYDS